MIHGHFKSHPNFHHLDGRDPAGSPAVAADHVGGGAGLVEEDQRRPVHEPLPNDARPRLRADPAAPARLPSGSFFVRQVKPSQRRPDCRQRDRRRTVRTQLPPELDQRVSR